MFAALHCHCMSLIPSIFKKREYDLQQLYEQMAICQTESDEKVKQAIEQFKQANMKSNECERERLDLRKHLQELQDENELLKSYINYLSGSKQNVNQTIEKLLTVVDFTTQIINNQNPDVLMLRLSSTKTEGTVNKLDEKLDFIVDKLLSIRSELISKQFNIADN
ncbi:unnamed protein product [Didymodactylos carnosus]|uniref:Uncharacterized protein n=1 Tax=Didymodactylos carnosus TaxID=1234261 RepID=A0A815U590_9BILA|nr:unnamed protein product [Didymodactylos carnosus]CAF1511185.1 unnamed protein product [Didymodactylos carnosus]CAF4179789.1 unnamed protein product [Didymodactylos carnosus]CAF4371915.1 unnamed protein product [Didymodactylos carnosus]